MSDRTTVPVSSSTADRLHDRKARGDTYDDVIRRLLDGEQEQEQEQPVA